MGRFTGCNALVGGGGSLHFENQQRVNCCPPEPAGVGLPAALAERAIGFIRPPFSRVLHRSGAVGAVGGGHALGPTRKMQ